MSWDRVVASLKASKRTGDTFEEAWETAKRLAPRSGNNKEPGTLFHLEGEDYEEESPLDSFRKFAEDAWYGHKPALRHFSLDMLGQGVDYTRDAKITGTGNYARAAA